MVTERTLTLDPETGEPVTLKELAERIGLTVGCLKDRYREGKRGALLVESVAEAKRRAGRIARESRLRRGISAATKAPPTPREIADSVLATPDGRLASRLFRDYAA